MSFLSGGGGGGTVTDPSVAFVGNLADEPGWGGITDNPARADFGEGGGVVDTGSFDTSAGKSGLFGLTGGEFNKAAGAFKDLGAATKSDPGKPTQQQQQAAAQAARGQAGGLAALLQILAARANAFHQAAHQGAVPPPTRPGGGLLGM